MTIFGRTSRIISFTALCLTSGRVRGDNVCTLCPTNSAPTIPAALVIDVPNPKDVYTCSQLNDLAPTFGDASSESCLNIKAAGSSSCECGVERIASVEPDCPLCGPGNSPPTKPEALLPFFNFTDNPIMMCIEAFNMTNSVPADQCAEFQFFGNSTCGCNPPTESPTASPTGVSTSETTPPPAPTSAAQGAMAMSGKNQLVWSFSTLFIVGVIFL
jgi:hypothetical protein